MKEIKLQIGDTWISESSDPWGDNGLLTAEIIDLRDGWVRYKSQLADNHPKIFSSTERYFRNCYTKKV